MFAAPVWHYWIGVLVFIPVMLITVGFIVVFLRKDRVPPLRPATTDRDGSVADRLGAGGEGCDPGRRAGAVRRVLPGALACSRTSTRPPRRPRTSSRRPRGLRASAGPARARVTDRAGWVHANVDSFQRLLRPLTDKLGERMGERIVSGVTRRFAGAEVGVLLGWMSTRVLGQYDLLVRRGRRTRPTTRTSCTTSARTCSPSRSGSPSHRRSSGCGWRSTRSPTGRSSPACRGSASTSSVS